MPGVVRVLVLADTHLRSDRPRWLPDAVTEQIHVADVVLHAGDVVDRGVLERLGRQVAPAPLHAVLGNNDAALVGVLPETKVIDVAGVKIGMIHDSGRSSGRAQRMRRRFPDCDAVVFGHSHEPLATSGEGDQLLFNPGSPTQRRMQPRPSFGWLVVESGRIVDYRIETI